MMSLRLALALTPAAQDNKRGEKTKYRTIEAQHQLDSSCSVNFSAIAGYLISGTSPVELLRAEGGAWERD